MLWPSRAIPILLVLIAWTSVSRAYVLMGMKWPQNSTTFHPEFVLLGESVSPSGVSWLQAFEEAADEWNRKTAFRFEVDASNPSHPCAGIMPKYPEDGFRNGAAFTSAICTIDFWGGPEYTGFGRGTLAVTMSYTEEDDPSVTSETDIFFNNGEEWDVYDGPERGASDFRRVALHELGHALGLDHERRHTAIMAPYVGDLYHLQPDDIAGVAALYGERVPDGLAPIVLTVEEPAQNGVKSGISTFRGWVVSLHELTSLSLYLDGRYLGELQHGGPRRDVARAYPDYPGSDRSGFAFAFSYGGLEAGPHSYRLVARDVLGNELEKVVDFRVVRFETSYLKEDDRVSVDEATLSGSGNEVLIDNLLHDGAHYRLRLRWNRGSQGFSPVEICGMLYFSLM